MNTKNKATILVRVERFGECWLWKGWKNSKGYGQISIRGKKVLAHRLSFELFKEKDPDGFLVCHTCDVPSCVNPDHLFLGTDSDNLKDASEKGRLNPVSARNLDGRTLKTLEELRKEILS